MIQDILKSLGVCNIDQLKVLMRADAQEIFKLGPKHKTFVHNHIKFVYNQIGSIHSREHKYLITLRNGINILL